MSSDLKLGDLCVVVATCCDSKHRYLGIECSVVAYYDGPVECRKCGTRFEDCVLVTSPALPTAPRHGRAVTRRFLRKIEPPRDDDATPRTDFTPAPERFEQLVERLTRSTEVA